MCPSPGIVHAQIRDGTGLPNLAQAVEEVIVLPHCEKFIVPADPLKCLSPDHLEPSRCGPNPQEIIHDAEESIDAPEHKRVGAFFTAGEDFHMHSEGDQVGAEGEDPEELDEEVSDIGDVFVGVDKDEEVGVGALGTSIAVASRVLNGGMDQNGAVTIERRDAEGIILTPPIRYDDLVRDVEVIELAYSTLDDLFLVEGGDDD